MSYFAESGRLLVDPLWLILSSRHSPAREQGLVNLKSIIFNWLLSACLFCSPRYHHPSAGKKHLQWRRYVPVCTLGPRYTLVKPAGPLRNIVRKLLSDCYEKGYHYSNDKPSSGFKQNISITC